MLGAVERLSALVWNDTITENMILKVDLAVFAVRELGLNYPYFGQGMKHSKTVNDEKVRSFSTKKDKTKHKKIPVLSTGKINLDRKGLEPLTSCV